MAGSRPKHSKPTSKPVTIDADKVSVADTGVAETSPDPQAVPGDVPGAEPVAFGRDAAQGASKPQAKTTDAGSSMSDQPILSKPETAKPAPQAAQAKPSGSGGGFVAGGIAGALTGGALALGLTWLGVAGGAGDTGSAPDQALTERIIALESRLSESPGSADSAGADEAVAALRRDVEKQAELTRQTISGLGKRVDAVAADVAAGAGGGDGGPNPTVTALTDRIAALEPELQALKAQVEALSANAPQGGVTAEMQALVDTGLNDLRTELSEVAGRIDALGGELAGMKQAVESAGSDTGLAGIVAASALRTAIDRGGSFAAELETFAALGLAPEAVNALRAQAGSGVKTRDMLLADFEDAAQAMLGAAAPASSSDGMLGRLMDSARGLVKVRPVGDVEGEGPEAAIARMGAALARGDDAEALEQFDSLPAPVQAAGAAFAADVRARMETGRLLNEAIAAAGAKAGN